MTRHRSAHKRTVLLTGATGLIGSYLLKILLLNGHKVFCLARGKAQETARQRVEKALAFWDKKVLSRHRRNLVVVEGDITAGPRLGLNAAVAATVRKQTEEIFHSAAVTEIGRPLEEIRKTNVHGTKNLLDFAVTCPSLVKVNHISTAYVAGTHQGIFRETDLDVGQKFNTTYEQSKFEAEQLAHSYRNRLTVDIFRPAMVVGESRTGKISQFKNVYQFLNLCKLELFDALPILNFSINLVFIDDTVKALYIISQKAPGDNKTYHIFPAGNVSISSILKKASELMEFKNPRSIQPDAFRTIALTPIQKNILKRSVMSLNFNLKLSGVLTVQLLGRIGFRYQSHGIKKLNCLLLYLTRKKR